MTQMFMNHDHSRAPGQASAGRQCRNRGSAVGKSTRPSLGPRRVVQRTGSGGKRIAGVIVPFEAVDLRAGVAQSIAERIETLSGDGDRIALVAGFPHPFTAIAADGNELNLHWTQ